jgi:hypothetical protein
VTACAAGSSEEQIMTESSIPLTASSSPLTESSVPLFDQIAYGTATMQSIVGINGWRAGFVVHQNLCRRAAGQSLDDGEFGLWMAYEPDEARMLLDEIDEIAQQVRIALEDAATITHARSNP